MNKKILLSIMVILLIGIVVAGELISKQIELDKKLLNNATTAGVDYSKMSYTKTTEGVYSLICLYDNNKTAYPCTKVLTLKEDAWIKTRMEKRISNKISDKSKPIPEGGTITIVASK